MKWYERLAKSLEKRGKRRMIHRELFNEAGDVVGEEPYLERFYLLSTPWLGVYLHRFWASDDDGLHDHPWHSASVLLSGGYFEEQPERQGVPYGPSVIKHRRPLHPPVKFRTKHDAHRITVPAGTEGECWSLFIRFGLKRRQWGFYRKRGWEPALFQSRKEILASRENERILNIIRDGCEEAASTGEIVIKEDI